MSAFGKHLFALHEHRAPGRLKMEATWRSP